MLGCLPVSTAQYKILENIDASEQAKFLALTKTLQPMVDKVLDLLPLYLAMSSQSEGARRMLVMVRTLLPVDGLAGVANAFVLRCTCSGTS